MKGVEILAVGEGATGLEPSFPAFLIALALCIIGGIIIGSMSREYGLGALVGVLIGLFAGVVFSIVVGIIEIEYYPTYKVIISNEVNMNEFTNRYEILEQEGRIYTVKETMPNAN